MCSRVCVHMYGRMRMCACCCISVIEEGCCGSLHPLGGAGHKATSFLTHASSVYTICVLFLSSLVVDPCCFWNRFILSVYVWLCVYEFRHVNVLQRDTRGQSVLNVFITLPQVQSVLNVFITQPQVHNKRQVVGILSTPFLLADFHFCCVPTSGPDYALFCMHARCQKMTPCRCATTNTVTFRVWHQIMVKRHRS